MFHYILSEIGVSNSDVADVIKLRCKNERESSFCVSLNNRTSENLMLTTNKWPKGVRVRRFQPSSNHRNRHGSEHYHDEHLPRFNNQYKGRPRYISNDKKNILYSQPPLYGYQRYQYVDRPVARDNYYEYNHGRFPDIGNRCTWLGRRY